MICDSPSASSADACEIDKYRSFSFIFRFMESESFKGVHPGSGNVAKYCVSRYTHSLMIGDQFKMISGTRA